MDKESKMETIDDIEDEEMEDDNEEDDEESSDDEEKSDDEDDDDEGQDQGTEVYLPGRKLEADEELVCDDSAYVMLHQAHTGAPCLSFDIIADDLGPARETFPLTTFIVAGTQAARTHVNK